MLNDGKALGAHPDFVSVDHVTITVQDMDRVLDFYAGVLGLRVLTDVSVDGDTTYGGFAIQDGEVVELGQEPNRGAYDRAHHKRRMVVFERVGGVSLSLVAHPGDELLGEPAFKLDRLGYTHLAFDVRDLGAFTQKLGELGAQPIAPGFYRDPEGNIIQVQEVGHADRIHRMYRERYTGGDEWQEK